MTKKKMTLEMAEKYIERGGVTCPVCGSDKVKTGGIEPGAGAATQYVECLECKAEWSDVFRLVGVYTWDRQKTFYPKKERALSSLTGEDWAEIYYALDSKALAVETGEFSGDGAHSKRWAKHLRVIMGKIGPDGENMI